MGEFFKERREEFSGGGMCKGGPQWLKSSPLKKPIFKTLPLKIYFD